MKVIGGLNVSGNSRFFQNLQVSTLSAETVVSTLGVLSANTVNGLQNILSGGTNITEILDGKKANIITVAKSGGDFTDIKQAVDWANINVVERTSIIIAPGDYEISETITANNSNLYSINGSGKRETRLTPAGSLTGSSMFILSSNTRVSFLDIYCDDVPDYKATEGGVVIDAYGSMGYFIDEVRVSDANVAFRFNGNVGRQFCTFNDILINGCKKGIVLDNGVGATITTSLISIDCESHIEVKNTDDIFQTQLRILSGSRIQGPNNNVQTGTGITISDGSRAIVSNSILEILQDGIVIDDDSILEIFGGNMEDCGTSSIKQLSPNANITFSGTRIKESGFTFSNLSNISGYIQNNQQGDKGINFFDEIRVGLPGLGKESVFGEGDSYTNGVKVFSFDAISSGFTDVTQTATVPDGDYVGFTANTADNAIYMSSLIPNSTGGPITFPGFKLLNLTGATLGSGGINVEFWDGDSWEIVNHMTTVDDGTFLPKANDPFTVDGSQQIRLSEQLGDYWVANDPVNLGQDNFWLRLRITSAITSSPLFDQFKLHTNRTEINADGFREYFGTARPIKKFPISYAAVAAAVNSPANTDMYMSDNLFSGREENNFQNGVTDQSGFATFLPFDFDTSSPLKLNIVYRVSSGAANDIDFTIRWGWVTSGDGMYTSTGAAPSIGPNEQSINRIISVPASSTNILFLQQFELDMPAALAERPGNDIGDLLFITFTREGNSVEDTYAGNFQITDVGAFYSSWNDGGHIKTIA